MGATHLNRRTDVELVRAARAGDADAYGCLVERYWKPLVRSLRRVTNDYHLAQDFAQEAFLRGYGSLGRLEHDANFAAWVARIARNIAVDRIRAERSRHLVPFDEPQSLASAGLVNEAPPVDRVEKERHALRVWSAVTGMADRDRRLMVLHYGRGLTHREIARECGLNLGSVKVALHRGRTKLANLVRPADHNPGGAGP